jgi:RNA polymerase sigma-70 factor, ECF subfamily
MKESQPMLINALESTQAISRQTLIGIYHQHNGELYRFAYRLTSDQDLAEECVSETFSRLIQAIGNGRSPSQNLRAWLFRVAHNWINDHYRKNPYQLDQIDPERQYSTEDNPADLVSRQMEQARVRFALFQLPEDQRQVLELRFIEEWRHEEVAAALNRSVEATRALQYRALAGLKRLLLESEE